MYIIPVSTQQNLRFAQCVDDKSKLTYNQYDPNFDLKYLGELGNCLLPCFGMATMFSKAHSIPFFKTWDIHDPEIKAF